MDNFYEENADYREFVDKNAKAYGKTREFIENTPIAQEYAKYVKDRDKGRTNTNEVKNYGC